MPEQNYIAFIDESGSLPDRNELVVVIAAVIADSQNRTLERMLARLRRKLPRKGKRKAERQLAELKFYKTSDKTRQQILRLLAEQDVTLFVLVVEKQGVGILDTPNNYAQLIIALLKICLEHFPMLQDAWMDRHFTRLSDEFQVRQWIEAEIKTDLTTRFVDSTQETRIDLADFVAGAVAYLFKHNDERYEELIRGKIVEQRIVRWKGKEKW